MSQEKPFERATGSEGDRIVHALEHIAAKMDRIEQELVHLSSSLLGGQGHLGIIERSVERAARISKGFNTPK